MSTLAFIRVARPEDARAIHEAHMKSIQEICSKDHSPEEIKAWGHRPFHEAHRIEHIQKNFTLVVEKAKQVEGFGQFGILEESGEKIGHLYALYFTPAVTGLGLGKEIMRLFLEYAAQNQVKKITLSSSLTGHSFYLSFGFVDVGPETTLMIAGQPVRCYSMEKKIGSAGA